MYSFKWSLVQQVVDVPSVHLNRSFASIPTTRRHDTEQWFGAAIYEVLFILNPQWDDYNIVDIPIISDESTHLQRGPIKIDGLYYPAPPPKYMRHDRAATTASSEHLAASGDRSPQILLPLEMSVNHFVSSEIELMNEANCSMERLRRLNDEVQTEQEHLQQIWDALAKIKNRSNEPERGILSPILETSAGISDDDFDFLDDLDECNDGSMSERSSFFENPFKNNSSFRTSTPYADDLINMPNHSFPANQAQFDRQFNQTGSRILAGTRLVTIAGEVTIELVLRENIRQKHTPFSEEFQSFEDYKSFEEEPVPKENFDDESFHIDLNDDDSGHYCESCSEEFRCIEHLENVSDFDDKSYEEEPVPKENFDDESFHCWDDSCHYCESIYEERCASEQFEDVLKGFGVRLVDFDDESVEDEPVPKENFDDESFHGDWSDDDICHYCEVHKCVKH